MLRFFTFKLYKHITYSLVSLILVFNNLVSPSHADVGSTPYAMTALTWNLGNTTVSDDVVHDFVSEITSHNFPDIIAVGTQEELAANGQRLEDKLLIQLNKAKQGLYRISAHNSYATSSGANNSPKTAILSGIQKTPLSKALNVPQNRSNLAILVKEGNNFGDIKTTIYYPPGSTSSNNGIILIKGLLTKSNSKIAASSLVVSISSVHLNSGSDKKRRAHTDVYLDKEGFMDTHKNYNEILAEAKRVSLIMGDFNERDYFMKDGSVVDRGYLSNFIAYGYDFSQKQERNKVVYGTYGFTELDNMFSENRKDSRGRPHNAKGGFLDRIAVTSGQAVTSNPKDYGGLVDLRKFEAGKKILFAGSDHLPVIRHFQVNISSNKDDAKLVKESIKRRLPNFEKEINDIDLLLKDKTNVSKIIFYDSNESIENFWKQLSPQELKQKKDNLEALQDKINELKVLIDKSTSNQFLVNVYNKITFCNAVRNITLEKMDDESNAAIKWYVPASLGLSDYDDYKKVVGELVSNPS